jgi:hypothetical protein
MGTVRPTPAAFTPARRVAETLSLRVRWAAKRDLMLGALERLAVDAYERTSHGSLLNMDVTGALLIPAPWSRQNCHRWGLRRAESDALRALLILEQRKGPDKGRAPLFLWDGESRRWFVDLDLYPTIEAAREYLRAFSHVITWEKVREAAAHVETHKPTGGRRSSSKSR